MLVGAQLVLYPLRYAAATLIHDPRLCSPKLYEALRRLQLPFLQEELCVAWWGQHNSTLIAPKQFSAVDALEVL